jgi:crossover junction endodeoxyribonuclease RusA
MIELTLPWPPTVNTYWRNFNGRTIISAKGREYRKAVADQVLIQRGAKHLDYALQVTIEAFRPDRRRRDLDNLLKAILDSLTHAGVMEDDCLIVDLRIYWADDVGGMVKVTIEGAE